MRVRRAPAAAALLSAASLAAPVRAQHVEGRGSLTAAASYNQTITDAQYPTSLTAAGPSVSFSPEVALLCETPRTNSTLTYAFTLNMPFAARLDASAAPLSYGNRFGYSGRYELGELSSLAFDLALNHAPLRALAVGADASQTQLDAVPAGAASMLGISAQERFTRRLSRATSLTQTNAFTFTDPIDPILVLTRTVAVQHSLSLDRTFTVDTLGAQIAVLHTYFTAGEAAEGVVIEPRAQIAGTLSLSWSRQLTESLSGSLALGATYLVSPGQVSPGVLQPTGSLSLSYRLEPAVITLAYARQAAPNLAAGSVSFTDSGTLRFSVPLGQTGLQAAGSGGVSHMDPLAGGAGVPTNVVLGDASLAYRPRALPTMSLGLRGQVQRQTGGPDALGGFTRVSGSFDVTFSYPSAEQATP